MSSRLSSRTSMSRTVGDSDMDDPHTYMEGNGEGEWTTDERKRIASVFVSFRNRMVVIQPPSNIVYAFVDFPLCICVIRWRTLSVQLSVICLYMIADLVAIKDVRNW